MQNFILPTNHGNEFDLSKCTKPIVIFFYPKDNTPGCTIENQDFAKLYPEFTKLGYEVVGVSRDSVKSHCNFANKFALPFPLLSDSEEVLCSMLDIVKNKKMYGKDVRGIERSTFILDTHKKIVKEWRKVKADGHAQEVLDYIKENLSK